MSTVEPWRGSALTSAMGIYVVAGLLAVAGIVTVSQGYADQELLGVLFFTFMDVVIPLLLIGAGVYLTRTELSHGDVLVATAWFLGGIVVLWLLYTWSILPALFGGESVWAYASEYVLFGNLGGAVGVIAGANRARARQNERLVEQTTAQQNTLEFINHLLRHNVLNGLQVIGGYTDILEAHVDDGGQRYLTQIDERGDHMTELIDNVRVLMRTLSAELELRATDLTSVLESELSVARAAFPNATFETDVPDEVLVVANQTLGAVFENVFANAVKHNDAADPHVSVAVETDDDIATVRVGDNGPGIPAPLRAAYFEKGEQGPQSTGEGLGLYLVVTLVEQYGGTVDIEDNDPRGTVIVLRLPLADGSEHGPKAEDVRR